MSPLWNSSIEPLDARPIKAINSRPITMQNCKNYCFKKNFIFAGVMHGTSCHCGNVIRPKIAAPKSECNQICNGDSSQICGGHWRINVFKNPG